MPKPPGLFRGIPVISLRSFLQLASCAVILIAAASLYAFQRQTDVFLLHSASELYPRYAGALSSPARLPADGAAADPGNILALQKLFDDFYVVKDGATDCSFVAALMLMLRRDPLYPFRIVRETPDGYAVHFPGLAATIAVTREDLRAHHENWKKTRQIYSRLWRGHIPDGLELLRAAYYNYQAQVGIRGHKGAVHGGGFPSQVMPRRVARNPSSRGWFVLVYRQGIVPPTRQPARDAREPGYPPRRGDVVHQRAAMVGSAHCSVSRVLLSR